MASRHTFVSDGLEGMAFTSNLPLSISAVIGSYFFLGFASILCSPAQTASMKVDSVIGGKPGQLVHLANGIDSLLHGRFRLCRITQVL